MATKTAAKPTTDLMLLLSQASHALQTELTAGLEALGISPRDQCVLSKAMQGEFTQGQLADMSDLDKTTMVVTIDALEKAGLTERRTSSTDRRAHIISVTKAGERMVAKGQAIVDRIFDDVLSALPAREREALIAGLARLVEGRLATPAHCEQPVRRKAVRSH